ncbi:MAG TPA: rod shape-determining protein MreD [Blastocatellia bacterium]|nr:rod shape-determining protein MreD [Blastocatellia bacterium]
MHTVKIALTILVALILQLVISDYLPFFKYLDLPLVVTVYLSLPRAPVQGMLAGVAAGLGGDLVTGGVLGVGGFSKTLIGYLIAVTSIKISLEHPLMRLLVMAVASAANTVLTVGLYQLLDQLLPYITNWKEFGRVLGWKVLADTAAAVVIFIILDRVFVEQAQARRMAIKRRIYE